MILFLISCTCPIRYLDILMGLSMLVSLVSLEYGSMSGERAPLALFLILRYLWLPLFQKYVSSLPPQPGHHCRLLALVPLPQIPQDGERGLKGGEKKNDINSTQFKIYCESVITFSYIQFENHWLLNRIALFIMVSSAQSLFSMELLASTVEIIAPFEVSSNAKLSLSIESV